MAEIFFEHFTIERFTLHADPPLQVGDALLRDREVAVVRAWFRHNEDEFCVVADLAPLESFSEESLDDAVEDLEQSLQLWVGQSLPLICVEHGLSEVWTSFVTDKGDAKSASWTRFQIAVIAHANAQNRSISATLNSESTPEATVYFLNQQSTLSKFKVHSAADIANLGEVSKLRIDSNRLLTLDQAIPIAQQIGAERIAYWEEPLIDVDELTTFRSRTGIPVALDETLAGDGWRDIDADRYVVKPTVLGWERTMEVVAHARLQKIPCVVSTSYESNIGRAFLREFAAAFEFEVGLGRETLFANDFGSGERHAVSSM